MSLLERILTKTCVALLIAFLTLPVGCADKSPKNVDQDPREEELGDDFLDISDGGDEDGDDADGDDSDGDDKKDEKKDEEKTSSDSPSLTGPKN